MSRFLLLLSLVLIAAAPACITSVTTETIDDHPVAGLVTSGPTCPLVQDPPDPACADRPIPGAKLQIIDEDGEQIGEMVTDPNGEFTSNLPAGRYTLVPQPVEGLPGTPPPQSFTAGPGAPVELLIEYDTGIR
jgi:hypothetical protein